MPGACSTAGTRHGRAYTCYSIVYLGILGHVLEWTLTAPLVLTGRLCAGVLWSISPRLVLLLLLYTGLGTWITTSLFGRKCAPPNPLCWRQVSVVVDGMCTPVLPVGSELL